MQANGESGLTIVCEGARSTTVVLFDGMPLQTAFGNQRLLTATIPPAGYRQPGRHTIELRYGDRISNAVEFIVGP